MVMEKYKTFLKVAAFITAIGLWCISVYFSTNGFGIEMPTMVWVGWILAIAVTVMELVMNRDGFNLNPTLLIGGILAYGYGIWTNIVGILSAQDSTMAGATMVLPVILAIMLEILPEPLILWSLTGAHSEDLISKLFQEGGAVAGSLFPKGGGSFASTSQSKPPHIPSGLKGGPSSPPAFRNISGDKGPFKE